MLVWYIEDSNGNVVTIDGEKAYFNLRGTAHDCCLDITSYHSADAHVAGPIELPEDASVEQVAKNSDRVYEAYNDSYIEGTTEMHTYDTPPRPVEVPVTNFFKLLTINFTHNGTKPVTHVVEKLDGAGKARWQWFMHRDVVEGQPTQQACAPIHTSTLKKASGELAFTYL